MKTNKATELSEQGYATFFGLNLLEDIMKLDPEVKERREAALAGRQIPIAETLEVQLGMLMDEELDVTEEEIIETVPVQFVTPTMTQAKRKKILQRGAARSMDDLYNKISKRSSVNGK